MKPQKEHTIVTLLENGISLHEINRKTGIDRKTVRKIAQALAGANSPMATGLPNNTPAYKCSNMSSAVPMT